MASRRLLVWILAAALGAPLSAQPPRPLSQRGTANLTAFARLLALVRFFHPSDAVAAADWNRVAVAGVGAVEGAEDPAALARALEGFFRPLAPTLRVYPSGRRPETPEELLTPLG
ncbi:MAG TPA: peptidase S41, partial [Thermoanaerobaculia bacterium]